LFKKILTTIYFNIRCGAKLNGPDRYRSRKKERAMDDHIGDANGKVEIKRYDHEVDEYGRCHRHYHENGHSVAFESVAPIIAERDEWREAIRSTGYDGAAEIVQAVNALRAERDRVRELLANVRELLVRECDPCYAIREIDAVLARGK
jgi:hypothetical protein